MGCEGEGEGSHGVHSPHWCVWRVRCLLSVRVLYVYVYVYVSVRVLYVYAAQVEWSRHECSPSTAVRVRAVRVREQLP
jgi:hypothetical protein